MPEITLCKDADDLATHAADSIRRAAQEAIAARSRFTLVLAGGSTPEKTYTRLAAPDRVAQIDWKQTFLFFGDERFVPADDPRSNYGMAQRTLIAPAVLPGENVFPVPTQLPDPATSAATYAETLARFFALPVDSPPPRFDLILLGLGDDGHTASLFPHMPTLAVTDRWVVSSPPGVLPPPVERITFTYPVLNAARSVLFLVSGEKKARVLQEVLEGDAKLETYPAAGVRPTEGTVTWLVDEAAARLLKHK